MRILVAVDGSEYSLKAINFSIDFASKINATVIFMHVIPTSPTPSFRSLLLTSLPSEDTIPPFLSIPECLRSRVIKQALEQLEYALNTCKDKGISTDMIVVKGDPAEQIIKESNKGFDIVVMGYRGHRSALIEPGDITEKVLRKIKVPLLIVK